MNRWMRLAMTVVCIITAVMMPLGAGAQYRSDRPVVAPAAARYYQLTLNLTFGGRGEPEATTQTITTEFVLNGSILGTCKARMVSQTPAGSGVQTKYIEVGTKFDANEIHLEGDGVAMHFVLSASRPVKMISYVVSDGRMVEEPVITDRTVELSVKVPLDRAKVVFDSSARKLTALKQLESDAKPDPAAKAAVGMPQPDVPMTVEIAVTELK